MTQRGLSLGERQNLLMSGERRRANTMVRTNAVLSPNAPVKQNSSPLPQERRSIYTKDHLYSKSWNPDLHYDDEESYQQAPSTAATRYGATNQTLPYSLFPSTNPAQPRRTSNSYHLSVRQPFERQAKSFDEWANERISGWTERRSLSEREDGVREGIQRQTNQQHEEALIAGTAIAHQCQSLWEARSHLEHLRRLGIEDPSSASTSFEKATLVSPRNTPRNGRESVDERRNKYRSLFLQRKTLPGQRVDSIESTFSNDSSMGFVDEMRRATLAQITSIDSGDRSNENASRRPLRNQRDYSVDATSDSMFREFSRVDPKYEMFLDSMRQNSDRDRLPVSSHFLPKWETFDIAGSQQKNRRLSTSRQMSQNENYRFA
ncbi:unnamed protein product, partial [Mesorhabditis belari]|uniref:Uncharacterized protein n=1 Tax=Mesorhabditis belari TaxID=2138241 RepID=A0AAF3J5N2_9BILA